MDGTPRRRGPAVSSSLAARRRSVHNAAGNHRCVLVPLPSVSVRFSILQRARPRHRRIPKLRSNIIERRIEMLVLLRLLRRKQFQLRLRREISSSNAEQPNRRARLSLDPLVEQLGRRGGERLRFLSRRSNRALARVCFEVVTSNLHRHSLRQPSLCPQPAPPSDPPAGPTQRGAVKDRRCPCRTSSPKKSVSRRNPE